jgi:cobalamin biosynthesis Mg chelatase CobN
MKVHASLEKLLLDYETEKYRMYNYPERIDEDDLQLIHHYASNNSLASVEPEPLAKNKAIGSLDFSALQNRIDELWEHTSDEEIEQWFKSKRR